MASPRLRGLVRDLAQDPDGTLWAVIEGNGLARYDGASWQARDDVSGLLEGFSQTALQGGGKGVPLSGRERTKQPPFGMPEGGLRIYQSCLTV